MITSLRLALALLLLPALASSPGPRPQAADDTTPVSPEQELASMDWLAGSWSGEMWGGTFVAHYSTPAGGRILSHSKLMRGGTEAFYEFEVFEPRDGTVHLQPFPGGEKAGGFTLASHEPAARRAVFENPDKDYPTRIVYERTIDERTGAERLVITLSDPHGGGEKVERFDLGR